jgi:hypothetical protein
MDKSMILVFSVIAAGIVMYFIKPLGGLLILALFAVTLFIWAKKTGAWKLMKPLPLGGSLCFYITEMGQILIDEMENAWEGYLRFKNGYGLLEVTKGSKYVIQGKPVCIAVEGVAHTVIPKHAKMAEELAKRGYLDMEEAEHGRKGEDEEPHH